MIAIVTDSTCDIPDDLAHEGGLFVVPALVHLGQAALRDGVELTRETFYEQLPGLPSIPTTSAPSPAAFLEAYEQALRRARQVVSIHCASQLSSIFNSARLAAAQIASDRIHVIDSGQVSMGLGLAVMEALETARRSEPVEGVIHSVTSTLSRVRLFALLDTLEYLAKSGRVNLVQLGLSSLLSIKPIVELKDGIISSVARVRTWSRASSALAERLRQLGPVERLAVMHSNCIERANEFIDRVRDVLPAARPTLITNATTVIGAHVGPGSIGFAAVTGR